MLTEGRKSALALLAFLALVAIAAAGGAVAHPGAWYEALNKPPLTPPNWLFAPAWSVLYLAIAVAGWLVWRRIGLRAGASAFSPYVAQLAANGLWSLLFFALHRPLVALVDLALLVVLIVLTMRRFARVSTPAVWLLVPYLLWVGFAAYLNAGIVLLN